MWYFYLINVIENLNYAIVTIQVIGFFLLALLIAGYFMYGYDSDSDSDDSDEKIAKTLKFILWFLIPFYIIITIVNILTPDKETMYLMAGAKATEMIAATPEASKAREVIDLGLDKILVELKDKK